VVLSCNDQESHCHIVLSTENEIVFFVHFLSRMKEAEGMEIGLLTSIGKRVEHENKSKMEMVGFDKEMESFILQKRRKQHKELLQVFPCVWILLLQLHFYVIRLSFNTLLLPVIFF